MVRPAPAAMIIGFLMVIVPIVLASNIVPLVTALFLVVGLLAVFRPPKEDYLARVATALPIAAGAFISMLLTNGIDDAFLLLLRVMTTVLTVAVLTSSVPLLELARGMGDLGLPRVLVEVVFFTFRYFQVLRDEIGRTMAAGRSRGFKGGRHLFDRRALSFLGSSVASIFMRGFKRGLSVQEAMVIRGYSGRVNTLSTRKFGAREYLFLAVMLSAGIVIAAGSIMERL